MKHETKYKIINFVKRLLKYKEREFPVFDRQDYQVEKIQFIEHLEDLQSYHDKKKAYDYNMTKSIIDELINKKLIKISVDKEYEEWQLVLKAELLVCI